MIIFCHTGIVNIVLLPVNLMTVIIQRRNINITKLDSLLNNMSVYEHKTFYTEIPAVQCIIIYS